MLTRALLLATLLAPLVGQEPTPEPPAPEPATAEHPGGVLVVLNKSAATADFVDTRSGEILRTLGTGEGPHEGVVSPDGKLCVVANYGGGSAGNSLTVFDLARGAALDPIDLGEYTRPHGLAFAGDLLLVTCEGKQALVGVDLKTRKITHTVDTGQAVSHMVAANADATRAFVANIGSDSMTAIDLTDWSVIESIETGAQAEGVDVTPDGSEVWVSNRRADTVTVLDAETLEEKAQLTAEGFPIRVKITPDGALALVSTPNKSDICVFDVKTRELKTRIPLSFDLADGAEEGLFGSQFGQSATPIGILIPPHGKEAYVACAAADRIAVIDVTTLEVTRSFAVGREPDGLAWYASR